MCGSFREGDALFPCSRATAKGITHHRTVPAFALKTKTSQSHSIVSSNMNQLPAFQESVSLLVLTLTRTKPCPDSTAKSYADQPSGILDAGFPAKVNWLRA